jgi:hypothetical protein
VNKYAHLLIVAAVLPLVGCHKEEAIKTYIAPKDAPPPAVVADNDAPIRWTTPPGWKALPAGQMLFAAYQVSENPPVKMTVSQVTSMGSGSATVMANVNRWRGQLGLSAASQADITKDVKPIQLEGREALLIDLAGNGGQRMLASMIPDNDQVWVFKMTGPTETLAAEKDTFEAVVKSAKFAGDADHAGHDHAAGGATADATAGKIPGLSSYTLPEGWQIESQARPMRVATLIVPSGNEQGEIVVTQLNLTSLVDLKANVNRWRSQVHLPPTDDAGAQAAENITFAQGPGLLREFVGPESEGAQRKRQLVAMTQFPGSQQIWFFRFVGPNDLVAKNKPAFESFLKSLKFTDK